MQIDYRYPFTGDYGLRGRGDGVRVRGLREQLLDRSGISHLGAVDFDDIQTLAQS